jgi:hypothetical protein
MALKHDVRFWQITIIVILGAGVALGLAFFPIFSTPIDPSGTAIKRSLFEIVMQEFVGTR